MSLPFLIAANLEHSEVVVGDMTWQILCDDTMTASYADIRLMFRHIFQAQTIEVGHIR